MVQVQSSWFPVIDRNPQTFVNIYTAKDSDFQESDASRPPIGGTAVRCEGEREKK